MKPAYLITARLKSTRLPKKILLDLNGISILNRVINRCKKVQGIGDIVLCTSTNEQDDELEKIAGNQKIKWFRGSEDDVLERLLGAAKQNGVEAFVSITADNPLHSMYVAEQMIEHYKTGKYDFIYSSGLPIGISPYFLDTKAVEIAVAMKKDANTEIWGPFINQPSFFRVCELELPQKSIPPMTRITCDYPEDFELFQKIIDAFPGEDPDIIDLLKLYDKNPSLLQINALHKQSRLSVNTLKKINNQFNLQREKGLQLALEIGKLLQPGKTNLQVELD